MPPRSARQPVQHRLASFFFVCSTHDHPHTHEQETIQNAFACIKMTRTAFYQCGFSSICLSVHDTHPARGAGRCRDTGCADAPVQLFWLFSIHQRSGKEDESKNQGEAAGRITAITKHYSSRAQSTKIGCAFSRPAPYSEERRRAVSKAAKKCGVNDIGRSVHKNLL